MVASVNTVTLVVQVIMQYVPKKDIPALIDQLKAIDGNKSFLETVLLIEKLYKS
jgi:hypothetical protein